MEKKNITVFGASGQIGRELLRHLFGAEMPTVAVTRQISKATDFPFITWIEADISDKNLLYKTMENTKSVFLLSGHSSNFVQEQANVIEVAKSQQVEHIVKLSSGAADMNSIFPIPRVHGEVEELINNSGIAGTFLRPNGFMQNWLGELATSVKTERKIYEATGDGRRAYIDLRDIAEVAFSILKEPKQHISHAYFLTGKKAVNYHDVAKAIGAAINDKVEYIALSSEIASERMKQKGIPDFVAKTLVSYANDQRSGKTTFVSTDVETILRRPPISIEKFALDYADCFR